MHHRGVGVLSPTVLLRNSAFTAAGTTTFSGIFAPLPVYRVGQPDPASATQNGVPGPLVSPHALIKNGSGGFGVVAVFVLSATSMGFSVLGECCAGGEHQRQNKQAQPSECMT